MDSEGFALLSFVANFNRLKNLSTDLELIKYVSQQSPQIEYRLGADGQDRIRKREGWETFVLPMGDRDPSAQNDGPGEYAYSLPTQPHIDTSLPLRHSSPQPLPTSPMSAPGGFQSLNGIPSLIAGPAGHESTGANGLGLQTSPTSMANPTEAFMSPNPSQSVSPSNADPGARIPSKSAEQEPDSFPDAEISSLVVVWRTADGSASDSTKLRYSSNYLPDGSPDGQKSGEEPTATTESSKSMPNGHSVEQQ
jgi:la-related protein 1